ncbi:hypothetical protein IAR55_006986 [Kwoniella newhampshirensis]|uniref:Endopeptidase S2P n=1 Tax=Kwoniella newhampshirensis TaxID=1651941 RepID=A0AAW0YSS7_9TREE
MLTALTVLPSLSLILLLILIHYLTLVLPSSNRRPITGPSPRISSTSAWRFERTNLSLSIWTASLNSIPRHVLDRVGYKWASRLKRGYDVGVGLGLLGCAISSGVAIWACASVWRDVWREAQLHAAMSGTSGADGGGMGGAVDVAVDVGKEMVKRGMMGGMEEVVQGASEMNGNMLLPLIPGITIPLSHLPTLVLAFVVNQLIHEFGHAISAALDDIQPSRLSFNLHLVIPSMMISFPSTVDQLDANAKMRLASSGPVHNVLTWFMLWLLTTAGAGNLFWCDRAEDGRVVQDVHWASPLYAHIQPGDLITHLDDLFIGTYIPNPSAAFSSTSVSDRWHSYLLSSEEGDTGKGWCMNKINFLALPYTPCEIGNELTFAILDGPSKGQERCLVPHPILDIPSGSCPCPDGRWVCIRPTGVENLLRIRLRPGGRGTERVVLWNGPREEVRDAVVVGTEAARGWNGGVRTAALFFRYLSTIALSLYFFNLLPVPYTDGSQLLLSLLTWRSGRNYAMDAIVPMQATLMGGSTTKPRSRSDEREFELDSEDEEELVGIGAGGGGPRGAGERHGGGSGHGGREDVWKRRLRRLIQWGMMVVVFGWIGGWMMLILLRSS